MKELILLNGKVKTSQIASYKKSDASDFFYIYFKGSPNPYKYNADKVTFLTNPQCLAPEQCKVIIDGRLKKDINKIWRFNDGKDNYWRLKYNNGDIEEFTGKQITVVKSCLYEEKSNNIFAYFKQVAHANPLRKAEDEEGILYQIYKDVDFIDENTAAACYFNPDKHKIRKLGSIDLIYPFGCNASQKKAVTAAFEHQVSVIQGPPGTGKTQTILNIIANIIRNGQTVLVVSSNNSAIKNVLEKLENCKVAFIAAYLGSKENKNRFIQQQEDVPPSVDSWALSKKDEKRLQETLQTTLHSLDNVYELLNEEANLRQEQQNINLEWQHYCKDDGIDENPPLKRKVSSSHIVKLWLHYQSKADGTYIIPIGLWAKIKEELKSIWVYIMCRFIVRLTNKYDQTDIASLVIELQTLYYLNKRMEIEGKLQDIRQKLSTYNEDMLTKTLTESSIQLFHGSLYNKYGHKPSLRKIRFTEIKDMKKNGEEFLKRHPMVLSTTFSARSCLYRDKPYDYIIMDEASQVSAETGALALTCAYNAVIVGDKHQLPNVVKKEVRAKLTEIMKQYSIPEGYDCAKNSFLKSICDVIKNVPESILREHYRCHPRIINFCNQKFYRGNLLIMTHDNGEKDVLCAYLTRKGNHASDYYNQREIDVVREEVLPSLKGYEDIGIVTPYNNQVNKFKEQVPDIDTATIHKFQGREKDAIIMSVVDNQISTFADDANILNVAVSRAKKKFCLVMTGNEQEHHGNILDLLDYIHYNNFTVSDSKVSSIFDYLYEQYTNERMAMLKHMSHISEYASENMTYDLIQNIIASDSNFSSMKVLCHVPIRQIIKDISLMSREEQTYACNYNTHVDFLIINRISKKPILAIETDGYSFHNDKTLQKQRDRMKDHIFTLYSIPLLRLPTKGSGERQKITDQLNRSVHIRNFEH